MRNWSGSEGSSRKLVTHLCNRFKAETPEWFWFYGGANEDCNNSSPPGPGLTLWARHPTWTRPPDITFCILYSFSLLLVYHTRMYTVPFFVILINIWLYMKQSLIWMSYCPDVIPMSWVVMLAVLFCEGDCNGPQVSSHSLSYLYLLLWAMNWVFAWVCLIFVIVIRKSIWSRKVIWPIPLLEPEEFDVIAISNNPKHWAQTVLLQPVRLSDKKKTSYRGQLLTHQRSDSTFLADDSPDLNKKHCLTSQHFAKWLSQTISRGFIKPRSRSGPGQFQVRSRSGPGQVTVTSDGHPYL